MTVRLSVRNITTVSYKRGSQAVEDAIGPLYRVHQILQVYGKETKTDIFGSMIMVQAKRESERD